MCFKKPKPPPKSQEDIELEKELKEQRELRKVQLAKGLREEKDARVEDLIARSVGLFGARSLITGPKGGAGYMGAHSGRVTGGPRRRRASSPVSNAPPIMSGGSRGSYAGSSGGGGGGSIASGFGGSSRGSLIAF